MSEQNSNSQKQPFVPSELRPDIYNYFENYPPLMPEASKDDIQRLAGEVIGTTGMKRLGLTDLWFTPEMWNMSIARSSDVIWTTADEGEAILLDLAKGMYYSLNQVATVAWEAFIGNYSLTEILSTICEHFDIAEDIAREDLIAFVAALRQKGLVVETVANQEELGAETGKEIISLPKIVDFGDKRVYEEPLLLEHHPLVEITNKSSSDNKSDKKDGKEGSKDGSEKSLG